MVAEKSRGSQNFWDALLALTPANFGPKYCFLVHYSPNPTCVPNLKLAEVGAGGASQKIWDPLLISATVEAGNFKFGT